MGGGPHDPYRGATGTLTGHAPAHLITHHPSAKTPLTKVLSSRPCYNAGMSRPNPYAQLAAEQEKRIDELIRGISAPNAMKRSAVELAKAVLELCEANQREFIRLLTER